VLFARHVAERFRHRESTVKPLEVEAIIITHGDADHFRGSQPVTGLREPAGRQGAEARVYSPGRSHNGLVKGPSNLSDREIFGRTVEQRQPLIVDLHDDPRNASLQE
jgi:glyoxylase-like metal-dependent hydrolase (beta-lactamase superfamily II)